MTELLIPELGDLPYTHDFEISPTSVGDNTVLAGAHLDVVKFAPVEAPVGMNAGHARECRRLAMRAAATGVRHAAEIHYTQGPNRWQGIAARIKDWGGHFPDWADCSSWFDWCWWNPLYTWVRIGDIINGCNWAGGFTGTMVAHGRRVVTPSLGDACFYGSLWLPYHVALWAGNGRVISHGREQGPELVPAGPVTQFRAYV